MCSWLEFFQASDQRHVDSEQSIIRQRDERDSTSRRKRDVVPVRNINCRTSRIMNSERNKRNSVHSIFQMLNSHRTDVSRESRISQAPSHTRISWFGLSLVCWTLVLSESSAAARPDAEAEALASAKQFLSVIVEEKVFSEWFSQPDTKTKVSFNRRSSQWRIVAVPDGYSNLALNIVMDSTRKRVKIYGYLRAYNIDTRFWRTGDKFLSVEELRASHKEVQSIVNSAKDFARVAFGEGDGLEQYFEKGEYGGNPTPVARFEAKNNKWTVTVSTLFGHNSFGIHLNKEGIRAAILHFSGAPLLARGEWFLDKKHYAEAMKLLTLEEFKSAIAAKAAAESRK